MTLAAAVLLVFGTGLELLALELGRRDLRDANEATERRKASLKSTMAPNKWVVDDWITEATRTRERGIYLFGLGLVLQAAAGLISL